MSRISRLAAVAVLTCTTVVTAGTQTASAAATDFKDCHGAIVETCIKLEVDGTNVRAIATIEDVAGGTDFGVDARWVKLQMFEPAIRDWVDVKITVEEGWEYTYDVAATGWGNCNGKGGSRDFRAGGWYKWRVSPNGQPSYDQMWTDPHGVGCPR